MRSRLGTILTTVGGAVGMLGVIAMAIGLKATLTPAMQDILFYKGLFAGSAILILLGAIYGRRYGREDRLGSSDAADHPLLREPAPEERIDFRARHGDAEARRTKNDKGPP